jgi:ligand-binding sensor domain-containing protein/signal transduction histidine kinase/DNA-binding response OmpR family regulator
MLTFVTPFIKFRVKNQKPKGKTMNLFVNFITYSQMTLRINSRILIIILLLSLMKGVDCSYAQTLSFDHLTLEEGLSQSTVLAITQDSKGFMWFGTREGLNRYDARTIKVYCNHPLEPTSLSDNFIYSLFYDSRDRLWVGTRTGLNLFNSKSDSFKRFYSDPENSTSISDNTVTCLLEDDKHNLWIGTREGLNLLIDQDSLYFLRFRHQPGNKNSLANNDIHSIFQDKEGIIWIGTSQGISRLERTAAGDFVFNSFKLPRLNGKIEKNNSVNTFAERVDGKLIVGTERSGLIFFDKVSHEFSNGEFEDAKLESKAIRSILKDPKGNFWLGTIGGLFTANADFSRIATYRNIHDDPSSLSDNSIRSLFYDRDGSYWIGTFHGGVNIYSAVSKQFRHLVPQAGGQELSFKVASAITSDRDRNFWIGTEGNGLLFLDRQSNLRTHFKHDERNVNSLCHDNVKCLLLEEGGIWVGTIKGLDFYDFHTKKFVHFRNEVVQNGALPDDVIYDLVKDGNGTLWVATYFGGLARVDPARKVVEKVYTHDPGNANTLSSKSVTRLFIDSKKDLWVGTTAGLNKMRSDGSFTRFLTDPGKSNTPNNYIVSIHEDEQNRLWVGTRGSGLILLSKEGKRIKHLSLEDGLPGNSIYAIQEDPEGYFWISTENGLSRLDPNRFTFKNYNRSDGLLCKEFNFNSHHRDQDGFFYFGGYNGVAYFHPDSIFENRAVPSLSFTTVRLFNKEIKANDGHGVLKDNVDHSSVLNFRHNQNIFSIEFSVLNYINSQKNQFAYKLAGFEEDWNYVKEPVATYMNLAPGTYTLLVKGSNNDGIWNDTPKSLMIHILPPPWKTWWAYTGYMLIFLSLLYVWARLNKKQIKLKHDLQLEQMEKIKQEEFHQAKLNFFINVAHEIRTPVTLMTAPIEHLLDNHSHHPKVKKELTLVKNNTDRLMRLINQLLDFQKQETGNVIIKVSRCNIVGFVREIVDSFQEYADSRKVSLNFTASANNIPLWFDREELSKVFFNILVNAMKFTPGGGEVNISICGNSLSEAAEDNALAEEPQAVRIMIEDNGLGIAPRHLEKIFHRFYQAENTGIQDAGFGIGLALAKGIIDLHRGAITVDSREATPTSCGFTRFTMVLQTGNAHFDKMQLIPEREADLYSDTVEGSGVSLPSLENKDASDRPLILLVEDNDEIRTYMSNILRHHYDVLESRNGVEGFAIAVDRLPNLIVSDVMMPVMNGIDLVCKLKKDQRTNHIPIILLTARGTVNHQVEGLEMGADDYLTKPFNTSVLLVKIRNLLAIREKLKEKYGRIVSLQPIQAEVQDPDDRFLQDLMQILEDNIENSEFNVSKLVREIGMSRPVLFRKTKMLTGLSVIDLIRNVRLKKAEMLLKQKKLSISEIAFTVGFSDPKYFSKSFRSQYGKPPSQYIEELGNV